jgi:hypothetical protein
LIAGPLQRRLARKPSFRRDLVEGTVRMWRVRAGNLPFTIVTDIRLDKNRLMLTTARLTASTWRDDIWANPGLESGISLIRFDLIAAASAGVSIAATPLVVVSLHALARRMQRGAGRDHGSVAHDISACLHAAASQADAIEIISGGRWLGSTVPAQIAAGEARVFACRTFIDANAKR